jgi:hypothetical protein
VLSFPSLASIFPIRTLRNALAILSITVGIGGVGWVLRSWVPPATLWMTDVAISTQLQDRTPATAWKRSAPSRFAGGGLYAYTAINARAAWTSASITSGSSTAKKSTASPGYPRRSQGRLPRLDPQAELPGNPAGNWQVRVLTEDGQVIGVLRFKVTDSTAIKEK